MCGIHFILDKHSRLDKGPIEAMVASTGYRGPDKSGIKSIKLRNSQYFLGANKLGITDTSAFSDQPFSKNGNPQIMIFNGEIYNYQNLKNQQLQAGISFQSSSDTEVLFNHIETNGRNGLKQLNGMFSIIFLDTSNGNLLVGRDRWGMKPLFVFEDENFLIYSSETKAILASGLVSKKLNTSAVNQYLAYKYTRRPDTFYEGINEFEPNTYRCYNLEGNPEEGFLVDKKPINTEEPFNPENVVKTVDKLLEDAILSHLAVSGPTGLFLSGGVDSTLLLAKMHELGIRQVPTYSFVSAEADRKFGTADYKFARKAARQYHATHFEISVNKNLLNSLDDHIYKMDQPVGDSGALITFLLSKEASKNTRVVFSGAGADEVFAGYNRHRAYYFYLNNYFWLKYLKVSGKLYGMALKRLGIPRGNLVRKFFESIHTNPGTTWSKMISFSEFATPAVRELMLDSEDQMGEALLDDQSNYLINDVLTISDRMSMQASIEMRMPYLDAALNAYVQTIPSEFLIKSGQKHILKKLLSSKGGKLYTQRPKEGLGLPFGAWIDNESDQLWDFIHTNDHIVLNFVDPRIIQKMIKEHKRGKTDHTPELWSVLILARWLEYNFA